MVPSSCSRSSPSEPSIKSLPGIRAMKQFGYAYFSSCTENHNDGSFLLRSANFAMCQLERWLNCRGLTRLVCKTTACVSILRTTTYSIQRLLMSAALTTTMALVGKLQYHKPPVRTRLGKQNNPTHRTDPSHLTCNIWFEVNVPNRHDVPRLMW